MIFNVHKLLSRFGINYDQVFFFASGKKRLRNNFLCATALLHG